MSRRAALTTAPVHCEREKNVNKRDKNVKKSREECHKNFQRGMYKNFQRRMSQELRENVNSQELRGIDTYRFNFNNRLVQFDIRFESIDAFGVITCIPEVWSGHEDRSIFSTDRDIHHTIVVTLDPLVLLLGTEAMIPRGNLDGAS